MTRGIRLGVEKIIPTRGEKRLVSMIHNGLEAKEGFENILKVFQGGNVPMPDDSRAW